MVCDYGIYGKEEIDAQIIARDGVKPIHLFFQNLTADERQILADGGHRCHMPSVGRYAM